MDENIQESGPNTLPAVRQAHQKRPNALQGASVKAIVDPHKPTGATRHIDFVTHTRPFGLSAESQRIIINVNPSKCDPELDCLQHQTGICLLTHSRRASQSPLLRQKLRPRTGSAYHTNLSIKRHEPDFIVQIDDGERPDDPINLIVEVKEYQSEDAETKPNTMVNSWIPGVNNLFSYGRWAFHEIAPDSNIADEFE